MEYTVFDLKVTDLVGYMASVVVMLSFLYRNILRLRIINSFGCALFVVYGLMLDISWPIVMTNAFILLIHFYYLILKRPVSEVN